MLKFFKKIRNNSKWVNTIPLFLFASLIIIYFLPTQSSFRYEYQKGRPWQHEDLIAPFDFAIYKTDLEIKAERDSALQTFYPYFVIDKGIEQKNIMKFKENFENSYNEWIKKRTKKFSTKKLNDSLKNKISDYSLNLLRFIYEKGIANFTPPDVANAISNKKALVILKDNVATNSMLSEVFTQKTAYRYIQKSLEKATANNSLEAMIINDLHLYDFIQENLFYDAEKSIKAKNNILNNISLTEGMIQANERIISKGDLVHNQNYKVLESLRKEYKSYLGSSRSVYWIYLGQGIMVFIIMSVLYLFLLHFRPEIATCYRKTTFVLLLIVLLIVSTSLVQRYSSLSIYLIPFVMVTIVIQSFFDSRVAFFVHIATTMLGGFLAPNGFEFIFLQFIAGAISIFSLSQIYRRGQMFLSVGLVVLSYALTYTALSIMKEGGLEIDNPNYYAYFAINGLLLLASYPLIFLFEKLFGLISDATLLELSDTNHKALRNLSEKAPGTFQHVMQVANLAEDAIREIGGNPLLMRVGALYHDIGKIGAPAFFIENQAGGINPHEKLTYEQSAETIINHVIYGLELGKKYKLPQVILDFIATHHGNSVVRYFYTQNVNKFGEEKTDIARFSYPGPSPFSKETAVLMMADAVEAASRTLKAYNETTIGKLVESIITGQVDDNQFVNADITFSDITKIKKVFKNKLQNIYHARIEYPKLKKKKKQS